MVEVAQLVQHLEQLLVLLDELDEPHRSRMYELLDGIDTLHRSALGELERALDPAQLSAARAGHAAVQWLFDAYGIGTDERGEAEVALESVLPFVHAHGGDIELLAVHGGVVRVRMTGACAGCTASAATLRDGVEAALREHYPGYVALEVADDDAAPHPPPAPALVQLSPRPR